MTCPTCREDADKVVNSRPNPLGTLIIRRRWCLACGHRWTTQEAKEEKAQLMTPLPPKSEDPHWVSIKDYARLYGVHRNTVGKWIDAGLVIAWKARHTVRVKRQPPFETRPAGPQPTS